MATVTDPARELAEVCERLSGTANERGDQFIAKHFNVEPWSTEFYQIIFSIAARADELIELVRKLDLDEDYRSEAISHVKQLKLAFDQQGKLLVNRAGDKEASAEEISAIRDRAQSLRSHAVAHHDVREHF